LPWFGGREKHVIAFSFIAMKKALIRTLQAVFTIGILIWVLPQPRKTRADGGGIQPGGRPLAAHWITRRAGRRDC